MVTSNAFTEHHESRSTPLGAKETKECKRWSLEMSTLELIYAM